MGSFRVFSQRTGRLATLAALTVATLAQAALPALASADSITSRSVALSSSSASATGVTYQINFTAKSAAGAYIVEFCKDSPTIPSTCAAPTGFDATGAALGTGDATTATAVTGSTNKLVVTNAITASEAVSDSFTGIKNPTTAADPLYARIVTYDNVTDAASYNSATPTVGTGDQDQGSVAIAITNTVGVSGAVLESLSFCAAKNNITSSSTGDCSGTGLQPPTLTLGDATTGLSPTALSSGTIYTQISTNAGGGAVVSLKSDAAACGGLHRAGDPYDASHCYIKPATADFTLGNAFFGVKTGAPITTGTNGHLALAGSYNADGYYLGFDSAHPTAPTSGVTSTYGDAIFNTDGGFANKLDMPLTFGASIANNTPAGSYSADLSLIATGTF